jgi:hypothetical protein
MNKIKSSIIILVLFAALSLQCQGASVSLAWDAPTFTNNVVKYKIYSGFASQSYYTNVTVLAPITTITINNLETNKVYYFAATAVSDEGLESEFSNEVFWGKIDFPLCVTSFVTSLNLGKLRNDFSGFVGMKFEVGDNPIQITKLGRYKVPGNKLIHVVKIVNATTGLDVPNGVLSIDMNQGTDGQFIYKDLIVPVVLEPHKIYYLVSQETKNLDFWYDIDTSVMYKNVAGVNCGIYFMNNNWLVYGSTNQSYGPLDFIYGIECERPLPPSDLRVIRRLTNY